MKNTTNIELPSFKKERLTNFDDVYGLNGFKLPEKSNSLFKYMPLDYLLSDQCEGTITFVSPTTWGDAFEQRYYKIAYHNIGYKEPEIYCLCLTSKQIANEDAMWRIYAKPCHTMVKARIDLPKLLELLQNVAKKTSAFDVYIGNALYYSKTEIKRINQNNKDFFPDQFDIEHYLTLMTLKRGSFSYENEVRIFIVKKENRLFQKPSFIQYEDKKTLSICIGEPQTLPHISNVLLSPYKPTVTPFPAALTKIQKETIAEEVRRALNGMDVPKSHFTEGAKCIIRKSK